MKAWKIDQIEFPGVKRTFSGLFIPDLGNVIAYYEHIGRMKFWRLMKVSHLPPHYLTQEIELPSEDAMDILAAVDAQTVLTRTMEKHEYLFPALTTENQPGGKPDTRGFN
ncbi:hypothetical protein D4R52_02000 [bacterium]|nr:MAG: hypothetical protein D4R52_02000 [bacterium]